MLIYKSTDAVKEEVIAAEARRQRIETFCAEVAELITALPWLVYSKVHSTIIIWRLSLTDKHFERKARNCEMRLKKIADERKRLAIEQQESRKYLKAVRRNFNYTGNQHPKC